MKNIFRLFLALALSVAFVSNAHAQNPETSEGRIIIAVNTDWGVGYFTDANGKLLFKKQFEEVDVFCDGYARVKLDGKYGYINSNGDLVVPCIYDDAYCSYVPYISDPEDGYFVSLNGKYGLVFLTGEEVVPCVYDYIFPFSCDIAVVWSEGKYGCVDMEGEIIVPFGLYDNMRSFACDGYLGVMFNNKCGFINTLGELVIPCVFDNPACLLRFSENLACVKSNDKWGFINHSGEIVIPCIYEDASDFSEGLAKVKLNGRLGYINAFGEVVIPCIYDEVMSFADGLAGAKCNDKWGFINLSGEVVIPCIYDEVMSFADGLAAVKYNGKWGFININKLDKPVISCIYDEASTFSEGLARVKLDGKYGFIDKYGNYVVPCIYDYVYYNVDNGLVLVKEGDVYKVINNSGKVIIQQCTSDTSWSFVE